MDRSITPICIGAMQSHDINEEIIESLYTEALVLADDARAAFDLRFRDSLDGNDDPTRLALSIEGLRTTTRVMHVLAWLLNQRAFHSGELTLSQLKRHGTLPDERPSTAENLDRLEPETRALIRESERLHDRVARLDRGLRALDETQDGTPIQSLHGRIEAAFAAR